MKKIIGLCILATVLTLTADAQESKSKFKFSVGGGISNISVLNTSASGFGLDLVVKTDISPTMEGFVQTGYNVYAANGTSLKYMPLLLGINFKTGNLRPGIGLGYGSFTYADDFIAPSYDDYGDRYNSRSLNSIGSFSISPQLGMNFEKVDLVASYTLNQVMIVPVNIFGLKFLYKIQ